MGRLDGKTAVVTGAGRGIGRETALLLAAEGAQVVVNDLGAATDGTGGGNVAEEVVAEIEAGGGAAVANTQTVATVEGGESMLASALDSFGGMDILVNNAGILRDRSIFNMEVADWDAVINVHLRGHYCCSRPFAKYVRETGRTGCRIINFSSVSGLFGNFGQTNYGAAKAGIAGFSRVLALELAKYGCTVNTISPGAMTRMTIPLARGSGRADYATGGGGGRPAAYRPRGRLAVHRRSCRYLRSDRPLRPRPRRDHAATGGHQEFSEARQRPLEHRRTRRLHAPPAGGEARQR